MNNIGKILQERNETVCTAESITGGKIGATLVAAPGTSLYYVGGFITYTAALKIALLGIETATIAQHSTVSEPVAVAMAAAAKEKTQATYAIAVTGNAGPTQDHNDKSVGLVWIAIATPEKVIRASFHFEGSRENVIQKTVDKSLEMLSKILLEG